jgi:M17 aminopeptidase N-terminal domain 2
MRPKRKEDVAVDEAQPSSTLSKKGRYKKDEQHDHKLAVKTGTNGHEPSLPPSDELVQKNIKQQQNLVEFTFGTLPSIIDHPFKATILILKRTTLQQMLLEGNQLLNTMLGIDLSNNILQSMYTDCTSGKSISVSSTYIDHEKTSHHKLFIMALPETVSRSNHPWSVHSISDAIKTAVGGSCSSSRIVYCGTNVTGYMGALATAIARAFSVYTRKTKKATAVSVSDESSMPPPLSTPRIHISYMTVNDSGIQEAIPNNNGSDLIHACESIQLAARLVDMVRIFIHR